MSFERYLDEESIQALQDTVLFSECLKKDCNNGSVFPAIRQNRVDFYHKGGRLFSWEKGDSKGFSTHHKYASVIHGQKDDYITDAALENREIRLISSFFEGYERIKENCSLYSGLESSGVSALYHGFSCAIKKLQEVSVLDIEIAFATEDSFGERKSNDRIDFVTIDRAGKLRFFEAKHYSNRASLRCDNGIPQLYSQLSKYDGYLKKFESAILGSYTKHVSAIMDLFDVDVPMPQSIDPVTKAIIFGFDNEQRHYLNKNIMQVKDKDEIFLLKNRTYTIGDITKADLPTLFRGGKQNWE